MLVSLERVSREHLIGLTKGTTMKRILLSLVLISATFACNAMNNDRRRFTTLSIACKSDSNLTLKQVNEALTDNTYVLDNPWVLGYMANQLQEKKPFFRYPEAHIDILSISSEDNIEITDSYLAQLRIIEFAHHHLEGYPEHSNYNLKPLEEIQALKTRVNDYLASKFNIEADPNPISSSTSMFPKKLVLNAAILIAAIVGWHYLKTPEKAK